MRVPINPQTKVPSGQLGYERTVDISAGTRALGAVVRAYGEQYQEDQRKKQLFDVQKMLVEETNALQTDFETRQGAQPLGAPNFTQEINDGYAQRHTQLVQDLRARNYSEDAINEFEVRLGTIRSQYVAKAIDFQDKSGFAKVVGETEQIALGLSQYANKNPGAVRSAIDELQVAVSNSGLDAVEQAQVFEKGRNVILRGAQEGFALQHPETVLQLYGMPDETKVEENETTGELVNLGQAQQVVATEFSNAGWNPNVIAGFLGNFHVEGGYTGAKGDGGTAAGIAQWRKERRANFVKMFGKDPSEATIEENAKFAVWEMKNPLKAGMTIKQRDAILAAKTPEEAAELVAKYYERPSKKYGKIDKRIEAAKTFVRVMTHATETKAALEAEPVQLGDERGRTGIDVLDLSTGPERTQMLTVARTIMKEREADAVAEAKAAHDQWFNGFLNGLQDGKLGQADLNAAYEKGLITDFDERKKAQTILDDKVKKDTDLQRFAVMLKSGVKGNPYDDDHQKAVDAGFDKAVELETKLGKDTSPFLIGLSMWQKLGVLPTQAGVMIRGALIGTDPNTVAAAASVASNMLEVNPNAFASVEGGEDIGRAAATYTHYVDNLGMNAQEAAQKIATMNSPEFQAKVKADEPTRNKFIKSVNEVDIERTLNNAIVGKTGFFANIGNVLLPGQPFSSRGKFTGTPQAAEARQTFSEIALSHYDKYHDPEAATSFAARQMSRFYGVEGGRLLKYPATKAYPEIQGSREYIFDQAKTFVDKFTGFDIPKEDIWLQPTTSGSTANAFRAGKAPPYELHFVTRKEGQVIYHHVPGKVFVADVGEARRAAAVKARKTEQNIRKAREAAQAAGFGL